MKFKNDRARRAFLDDYRNTMNGWQMWKVDPEIERRMWKLDIIDDISIIVEEERMTFAYPEHHEEWVIRQWYITDRRFAEYQCGDGTPHFSDYKVSKTQVLEYIKEVEKR